MYINKLSLFAIPKTLPMFDVNFRSTLINYCILFQSNNLLMISMRFLDSSIHSTPYIEYSQ